MTARVHPERGETARDLRWVASAAAFPVVGEIVDFGAGVPFPPWLATARVESDRSLVAVVHDDTTWAQVGDEAWEVFTSAAAHVDEWTVVGGGPGSGPAASDVRLADAVRTVLDGPFGTFVDSHAGRIELVDAHDGVVSVRLAGTCRSCSLSDWTIRMRLERDLRAAAGADFSDLVVVP